MAAPDQEWVPGNVAPGGAQGPGNHDPGIAGHQEDPDSWRRRTGRLVSGGNGWTRRGRLDKVVYWYYTIP